MSDSHDNLTGIDLAIKTFRTEPPVDLVIHCGDFCSPFALRSLRRLEIPLKAVTGNNDGDLFMIRNIFDAQKDWELKQHLFEIDLGGQRAAILHGDIPRLGELLLRSNGYDWIFLGHNHQTGIEQKAKTTLVNPGETCGWLTGRGTVAKVDTDRKSAQIIELFVRD